MNTWKRVILLIVLAMGAYRDWKERQICLLLPVAAGILGLLLWLGNRECTALELAGGIGVGAALLFIAWLSRGQVGIGDGMMLVVSGIFLGFWGNMGLLLTALLLAAAAALYLIVVCRRRRNYQMPFLPFLLAAYLLQLI